MGRARTVNIGLPKGIYTRGGKYYVRFRDGTEKLLIGAGDVESAISARDALVKRLSTPISETVTNIEDRQMWSRVERAETFEQLPAWATMLYRKTMQSARTRKIGFALSQDEFLTMVKGSRGRCCLSGIKFNLATTAEVEGSFPRRPYAPSVDRINSKLNYTADNVRLVCVAVNYAMNFWGEDVLLRVATGVYRHHNEYAGKELVL